MIRVFSVILFLLLLIPFLLVGGEPGKKTFYPASSLYFWILAAGIFYIAYLYSISKDRKAFFKSTFILSISFTVSILFVSFFAVNLFLTDPFTEEQKLAVEQPSVKEMLKKDKELAEQAEAHFTDVDLQLQYITEHYQMPGAWSGRYENEVRDDYTIYNFYLDKLQFTEKPYVDMAKFGLSYCNYKQGKYLEAKHFLDQISDKSFPYLNFYQGNIQCALGDSDLAVTYYKDALQKKDRYTDVIYRSLVTIWMKSGNYSELTALLYNPETSRYIPSDLASRLYFADNNILAYYKLELSGMLSDVKITGAIAAFIIMLVWLYYIVRIDIFEKEGNLSVILTLITGMITSLFCFYFYDFLKYRHGIYLEGDAWHMFLYSIFAIGLIEEVVKILPLLLILLLAPRIINEAYDYILYASVSALGFAFMENLLYFDGDLAGVVYGRAMLSVPGHMMDSSIVAYGFVLSRYRYKSFPVFLAFPVFLLLGCLSHGLYDFWIFVHLKPLFYLNFLVTASIWIIIINNCMNNSPMFTYSTKFQSRNIQIYMGAALMSVLILQYMVVAWEQGPSYANRTFTGSLFFGGIFITYYLDKLSHMDLVKGYWNTISFTTVEDKRHGESFNLRSFFLRLIAGDIVAHSFVGNKVILQCDPENQEMYRYFSYSMKAEVTDRLIVNCKSKTNFKEYKDPFWFRLRTANTISTGPYAEQDFIFKFEEVRPSFQKEEILYVYLYSLKNENLSAELIKDKLRPLGRLFIRLQ
ncbi:MAG: PrsW family glutamic-type intramembrane protease [Cytophagaceae bacterium]